MYGPPPQGDLRGAEQLSRQRQARLESAAARNAQLGVQRPRIRERMRHWSQWLTRRKSAS
jgi:hypothetical protein